MIWLILLCVLLGVVVVALCVKIAIMRRTADEIRLSFAEKLHDDTNTLITVSSSDKAMRTLANDINVQLRELNAQRHRFVRGDTELKNAVTNISHDLRTPLTAINGYLELLEKEEKSEAVARYVAVIANRAKLLSSLTEELFRYSVITSPEYDAPVEQTDVGALLEESILSLHASLAAQGIVPDIRMCEKRVVRTINRAALSRVFSNLLGNAMKYSDGDLEITLAENGDVTFTNTASGLSEVQFERLFDRFFTVENARRSTGLGLSIVRVLVGQMRGTVGADYRDGRLSIRISLPECAP